MKKLLFVIVTLGLTTGFAKNEKKESRKPANSSTMKCSGLSYAGGGGWPREISFATGFNGEIADGFKLDGKDALEGRSLDAIDEAILVGKEFSLEKNKYKFVLDKKSFYTESWHRGETDMSFFKIYVDGKIEGGGVCHRYNH